jgi:oxygen-dependent protoporphyrinogen oxidase
VAAGYGIGYFHLVWNRGEGLSRNLIGGSSVLPNRIAGALSDRIRTRAHVDEVCRDGDSVRVRYTDLEGAHEIQAGLAVVATPAYVTRTIVRGLPADTDRALGDIVYGPYTVAAFLTDEPGAMPFDGIYAIAVAGKSFNMFFNMANVIRSSEARREPGGSLMVYSGARLGREMLQLNDAQIASRYLRDLDDLYPGLRRIVKEVVLQRWEHGLPYPRPGRYQLQAALQRPLGNIFLAGDYLGSWYTDTAIQTGTDAAVEIRQRLASRSGAAVP